MNFSVLGTLSPLSPRKETAVVSREIGRPLPATLLFERPTLETLADYVLEELGFSSDQPADTLNDLSTDELGMLLDQELSGSGKGAQT